MNDKSGSPDNRFIRPVIFGLLTGVCCWMLLDWRVNGDAAPWIWMIVMGCLVFRLALTIYVVTALALVLPLLRVQFRIRNIAQPPVSMDDVMFTFMLIGFVFFGFRLIDSLNAMRQSLPGNQTLNRRPVSDQALGLAGAWLIPFAVLFAVSLLALFPENPASRQIIRLTPGGLRTVTLVWLLGIGWLVAHSTFGLVSRFRMTGQQASLYIRSSFAREIRSEMSRIERSRARQMGKTGPGL